MEEEIGVRGLLTRGYESLGGSAIVQREENRFTRPSFAPDDNQPGTGAENLQSTWKFVKGIL